MQLARFRIPRPAVSFEWLGTLGGRNTILYLGYTSVLFLVFLALTFPHEMLIRHVLTSFNRGNVNVDFNSAGIAWTQGYELTGLRVTARNAPDETPYIECSRFFVHPAFGELMRGNPYALAVSAELYGGSAARRAQLQGRQPRRHARVEQPQSRPLPDAGGIVRRGPAGGPLVGPVRLRSRADPISQPARRREDLSWMGLSMSAAKINGYTVPDAKLSRPR